MARIILINFSQRETQTVSQAGYNAERGLLGKLSGRYLPFYLPHPLYEYDISVYNSYVTPATEKEFLGQKNFMEDKGSRIALETPENTPLVRIAFVGESSGMSTLLLGGMPFVHLSTAHDNVSLFEEVSKSSSSAIPELHELITRFKKDIVKVGQFIRTDTEIYPFNHKPVLASRSGHTIAAYGTTFNVDTFPRYIILPKLSNPVDAVIKLLRCLEKVWPQLFTEGAERGWLSGTEFVLPEEKEIDEEIRAKIDETTHFIEAKRRRRDEVAEENYFVRELLVATEDSKRDPSRRLSGVVKKALEFLEFKVIDIDAKTKGAIKKEDLWVIDEDFLAITEVSGTAHKNPKIKEFNDILARIATIYKRKSDLVLPATASVSGLLVLNYDLDTHPSKRPKMYSAGEEEHIVATAVEQSIGLLSTVELHKVVVAVKNGATTKEQARALLKRPGRIEFDPSA